MHATVVVLAAFAIIPFVHAITTTLTVSPAENREVESFVYEHAHEYASKPSIFHELAEHLREVNETL
jgi:hypothetical protein